MDNHTIQTLIDTQNAQHRLMAVMGGHGADMAMMEREGIKTRYQLEKPDEAKAVGFRVTITQHHWECAPVILDSKAGVNEILCDGRPEDLNSTAYVLKGEVGEDQPHPVARAIAEVMANRHALVDVILDIHNGIFDDGYDEFIVRNGWVDCLADGVHMKSVHTGHELLDEGPEFNMFVRDEPVY